MVWISVAALPTWLTVGERMMSARVPSTAALTRPSFSVAHH
jgi:hypothetical protein